jgi:hypothetical protein
MQKVAVKKTPIAICAVALLVLLSGCKIALYPLARAFGGMSESELASCRTHLRKMQGSLPKAKLTVHPPSVTTQDGGHWEANATARLVEALKARGFEDVVADDSLPAVPVQVPGHNQLRFETRRAHAYSAWAQGAMLGPGWHLFADFVVIGDHLVGINTFVTDSDGHLALVWKGNSHSDGWKGSQPGSIEPGYEMLADVVLWSLKANPERLYPPYGVG